MTNKIKVLTLLAGLFIGTATFATEIEKFNSEIFMDAQKAGKKIVLHYHADWCPTCRKQNNLLSELVKDSKYKDLIFIQANYDKDTEIKKKHNVKSQSTLIYFKGETEVSRSLGQTDKKVLADELNNLAVK